MLDTARKVGATSIQPCSPGQVSFWSGSPAARTPTDATTCKACTANTGTVAPRAGEAEYEGMGCMRALPAARQGVELRISIPSADGLQLQPLRITFNLCFAHRHGGLHRLQRRNLPNHHTHRLPPVHAWHLPQLLDPVVSASLIEYLKCSAAQRPFRPSQLLQSRPRCQLNASLCSDSCTTCPAGWETGTSGRTACTKW